METKDFIILIIGGLLSIPIIYLKEKILDKWFSHLTDKYNIRKRMINETYNKQIEVLASDLVLLTYYRIQANNIRIKGILFLIITLIFLSLGNIIVINNASKFELGTILTLYTIFAILTTIYFVKSLKLLNISKVAYKEYLKNNSYDKLTI